MNHASPSPQPVLDVQGTLDRLKGDTAFMETLFTVYVEDLPVKLAAIEQALAQADMPVLQRTAHSLKGASATVGALALRDSAFAMENAGRDADSGRAAQLLPELKRLADATIAAINAATPKP
ncbi:MAG: Hpt domain-containing protein [Thermodesulfobacteriota bacterium]